MSTLATINRNNTETSIGDDTHKAYATARIRMATIRNGQSLNDSPTPTRDLGLVLPALVAAAGSLLVIGSGLIALGIPAHYRDGAVALLLIVLFFGTALLIAGMRRRCPSCRKLLLERL